MTETQRDVVDLLSADNREFERIFGELEQLRGRTEPDLVQRKRELVDEVTIGLAGHSVDEETQVYPLVEKQLDEEEAQHSKEEHAAAEETMKRLERMAAGDPGFDAVVTRLVQDIHHQVEHEENRMIAELRADLPRPTRGTGRKGGDGQEGRADACAPHDAQRRRRPDGRRAPGQSAGPPAGRGERPGQDQRLTAPPGRPPRYRRSGRKGVRAWIRSACWWAARSWRSASSAAGSDAAGRHLPRR